MTIHLAFDQFQSVDLTFGLAIALGRGESGAYCVAVFLQPRSERSVVGTPHPPASTSQASSSAPAAPASVLLPALQPRTRAMNLRASFATVRASLSCSTRPTVAPWAAGSVVGGCTSSHASCRAAGNGVTGLLLDGPGLADGRPRQRDGAVLAGLRRCSLIHLRTCLAVAVKPCACSCRHSKAASSQPSATRACRCGRCRSMVLRLGQGDRVNGPEWASYAA